MGELLFGHLPFSDRCREWLFRAFFFCFAPLFIPMFLLNVLFYSTGSLAPDPSTGRVYPVHEHGILYVLAWQGELATWLFWGCAAVCGLLIVVNPFRGRLFRRDDE